MKVNEFVGSAIKIAAGHEIGWSSEVDTLFTKLGSITEQYRSLGIVGTQVSKMVGLVNRFRECGSYPTLNFVKEELNINIETSDSVESVKDVQSFSERIVMDYVRSLDNMLSTDIENRNDANARDINWVNNQTRRIEAVRSAISKSSCGISAPNLMDFIDFRRSQPQGLSTGIKCIDEECYGFARNTLATIAAASGHGKSTVIESIVYNNIKNGKRCLIISREMQREVYFTDMFERFLYEEKGIELDNLKNKLKNPYFLTQGDLEVVGRYYSEFEEFIDGKLMVWDPEAFVTISFTASDDLLLNKGNLISFLNDRTSGRENEFDGELDMVAFDFIQQWDDGEHKKGDNAMKTIQEVSRAWKDKRGVGASFIVASQINREAEKEANKERNGVKGAYTKTCILGLSSVYFLSDYVFSVYRDDTDRSNVWICKLKARNSNGKMLEMEPVQVPAAYEHTMVGGDDFDLFANSDLGSASEDDLF